LIGLIFGAHRCCVTIQIKSNFTWIVTQHRCAPKNKNHNAMKINILLLLSLLAFSKNIPIGRCKKIRLLNLMASFIDFLAKKGIYTEGSLFSKNNQSIQCVSSLKA
jgi:hypothetical protein